MKIFFTASKYESTFLTETNYIRALTVLEQDIDYFSVTGSVFQTFEFLQKQANYQPFIWIDSDNWLYDDARAILSAKPPAIMLTCNEYDIVYGHGGIKYCDGNVSLPQDYVSIDCSKHARYHSLQIVGSYHHLGDGWRKIRTIWVEMCKLALRGRIGEYYLNSWRAARPDIWLTVHQFLTSCNNIRDLKHILNNRVAFLEYYESKLRGNLQE